MSVTLETACELDPRVSLRQERFGALAYHFENRKLVFLQHPDVVAVVRDLSRHPTLADTLTAIGVHPDRWPSFVAAVDSLCSSEIIRVR